MAQKPLEILVKKGLDSETQVRDTPTNLNNSPKIEETVSPTASLVNAQIVNIGKQGLNMAVRNYGDVTGRAKEQQSIENVINVAGVVGTFVAAGPIVGTIALGAMAGLELIQTATDNALKQRQRTYDNARLGGIIRDGNR